MKKIILSFDDGREDFYKNAFPLLKKYEYKATLNIITNFVGTSNVYYADKYISNYVSLSQIEEMKEYGVEIANHSSDHSNEIKSVIEGDKYIKNTFGLTQVGFASPHSYINNENLSLYKDSGAAYIRSGRNLINEGLGCIIKYMFNYVFNRRHLLWNVYRDLVIYDNKKPECYYAISIDKNIPIDSLEYFISKMPDNSSALFMFHSILKEGDIGYDKTRWSTNIDVFEKLLQYLKNNNIQVVTNMELDNGMEG